MKMIINADDLGRTLEVDKAIELCMSKELINSTTIMANGEDFANVKALTEKYPNISYGVHLVIDEMECLTKPQIFVERGITDTNGYFIKNGIRRALIDKKVKDAVFNEWSAQIDKIQAAGISIDHIDSHHHLHTMPELFGTLKKITQKYSISKVRISQHFPRHLKIKSVKVHHKNDVQAVASVNKVPSILQRIKGVARGYYIYYRLKFTFDTTDAFCSVSTYLANRQKIDTYQGFKTIELMCHPGHHDYDKETDNLKLI